jgi:hypothetical protein
MGTAPGGRTFRVWKKRVTWARVRGVHQAGHHLVRVVGIGDEMQHRDQQDADQAGQVQGAGGGGQDRARNSRANRATSGIDGMTWRTRSAAARSAGKLSLLPSSQVQALAFSCSVNVFQVSAAKASWGPSGCLLSRTATAGPAVPTSTQAPPLSPL